MTTASEFSGEGAKSGVAKKSPAMLSASEKLRLGYTTGIEDPDSELDRSAWLGELPGSEK